MIEIKDILHLIGNELKDGAEQAERFREFIEQDKWSSEQIKGWLDECINKSSGAHDPYNRAFQDLAISLGKRLGFEIEYGRYVGKSGEDNYDGVWRRENGDTIVLEVKTSTWPIGSVTQLGDYLEKLSKETEKGSIFGLYIIGKGDIQPLTEQILGSKYKDRMRLVLYEDLMEIINLKEELVPVIGEKEAIEKVQNLLLPVESINIGNIVRLIIEIATTKSTVEEEPGEGKSEEFAKKEEPWTKAELLSYLKDSTPYQRLLLAALVQVDKEPATSKTVTFLMNEIAKRRPSEGIDKKITGRDIAGARAGLKMRRKPLEKEDIIESSWSHSEKDHIYKIKEDYKQIVTDWVKGEKLWIKEEIG
ncbi:hypothetical protein NLD30_00910 [SCandidatus Aminicenantes bacterium Aminicenantia_JdfR_composite]|jgi:hypothetical protein|nr:hypothetical protein [SCandidatus Aminicenantes bacterium Aminicenantia_JdfR_composite]MCP2620956.1 hypothetical protein [Candidatus Aminicenantes bacterium AC-334-E05]MCP2620968.1 hypothetical protein [Candidatus Aminicenantes bacterium AC-334-E05]